MEQLTTKDYVWEAKYRPARLKDVILPTPYRNFFMETSSIKPVGIMSGNKSTGVMT